MGTNDLAKETRARLVPGRAPMVSWLARCLLAAHAHDIDILDGVYNDLSDVKGFEAECAQARDMGFDGKTLIHPNQIEPCNAAFSPSADEVAHARKMIAAFELPENKGKGVVQVDGRMVERMHAEMAQPHGRHRRRDRDGAKPGLWNRPLFRITHGRASRDFASKLSILSCFCLGQPDVVEAVEHGVLAVRVDVELHHAAVGAADFLLLQIDRQRRVGAAFGVVEQLFEILGD